MIKVKKYINEKVFVAHVESYLKKQAEALLDIIGKIEMKNFTNKFTVQVGFTAFQLRKMDDDIIIFSPDYSKNPLTDITEDLTVALWIQLEQSTLLKKLNLTGELISFRDKIVCSKGVLQSDNIYLERSEEFEKGDSGWYIGEVEDNEDNEEYEAYYAYQILKIRPSILQVLALPNNYMAVFNKDELEAVLNDDDINLLEN